MDRTNNRWIQCSVFYVLYLCFCKGQVDVQIQPSDVPWENTPWTLECSVNSIVSTVSFTNPMGTVVGFCDPSGVFPASCTPNTGYSFTINETANTVSMTRTITNSETGNWTCKHGGDIQQYVLSSPLPSRNFPDSSTSYLMHSMSSTAGSELISGTESNFTFHYGCLSSSVKFVWTTVPGSSSEDTSNTISNGLTCTTNSAYMSTLDSTAAILQSVSAKGTTLSVSVFVSGYYNLPALVQYTYDVTFSPGQDGGGGVSDGKTTGIAVGTAVGGVGVVGAVVAVIIIMITGTVIKVYVKKGHDITFGESLDIYDVQWTKDGKKVESNLVVGTRCRVERASEEQEGLYVCTSGKYKKKYRLIVFDEIVYIDKSLDTEYCLGPGQCGITDAVWKKNGRVVKSIRSAEFKLFKASVKDEGIYVCILKSTKKQFKYFVIVVGTEEMVYTYQGKQAEFGKTIPDENTTVNAQWSKNKEKVESHHSERTKFGIDKTCGKDEGLYVCTFGSNNMTLTYYLFVVGTVELFSINEGDDIKFGKEIPINLAPTDARWTQDDLKVESHKSKGTVIEINTAVKKDEGLYVLTIGPNNMQCQYKLTVLKTEEKVYARQGLPVEFGKTISNKKYTENAQWRKNKEKVVSDHSERTKLKFDNTCGKDEGLYVCTFGPGKIQLKYYLIVVGTEESLSLNEGDNIKFGKDIPIKFAPTSVRWTRDNKEVESDKIKGTVIEINNVVKKDEGLYVLTFGPKKMQCQYKLTVLKSDDVKETVKKLKKKKKKKENGEAEEEVIPATVETLDETQERLQRNERLPPVENPVYKGSSPLAKKTFGTPLPPLSNIPADNTNV